MTFKDLNFKQKLSYIYDYYRYYFYIFIVLLVMFFYFLVPIFNNFKYNTVLSLAIVDCNMNKRLDTKSLETDLLKELNSTDKYDKIFIDTSKSTIDTENNSVNVTVAFSIASGNDIIVCDEKTYQKYKDLNAFQSWQDFLGDDYKKYQDYIDNDKLLLDKSTKWADYGYTSYSPVYAVILSSPTNPNNIHSFATLLFD